MDMGGEAFLGGHTLDSDYGTMLSDFWNKFRKNNEAFHLFQRADWGDDLAKTSIPILLRGDEGRGKSKRAIMVLAIQPLVSWQGPNCTNTSGCLVFLGLLGFLANAKS